MIGSTGFQIASKLGGPKIGGYEALIAGLATTLKSFTEALNPGMMGEFNRAMMDLAATIGTALEPVFQALIPVVQNVAGTLLPAMQALAPVFTQVGQWFENILGPAALALSIILQALAPVVALVLEVSNAFYRNLMAVVTVILTVYQTLFQWLASLVNVSDFMKEFKKAMATAVSYVYLFAASIAKALGANEFIKNLIDNLTPKQGVAHAATSSSIQNFESISKDMASAAFIASGNGNIGKEADLGDVIKELKLLQEGKGTWMQTVQDIKEVLDKMLDAIKNPGKAAQDAAKKVGGWFEKQWDNLWK
jgi:hypothetical protein